MSSQFQSHAKQMNKEKKRKRKKENMKRKKRQVATGDMARAVDKKLVRCYLSRAAVVRPMTTAEALHSNSMFDAPSAASLSRASCLAWPLVVASSRTSNGGADSDPSIRWLTISLFCPAACRRRAERPSDGPKATAHDSDATQIGPHESRIVSARDQDPAAANPQRSPLSICGEAAAAWRDKHPVSSLGILVKAMTGEHCTGDAFDSIADSHVARVPHGAR
ncbi:hypothetical protein J3E69DRAFT_102824 [Trichoderma sp. SZMC 28015]